jgi:hypothetical protein
MLKNNENLLKSILTTDVFLLKKKNIKTLNLDSEMIELGEFYTANITQNEKAPYSLDNLYTEEFYKMLKDALGNGKKFCELSPSDQEEIQNKMNSIFYFEDHFKNYYKKNFNNPQMLLTILSTEFQKFKEAYELLLVEDTNFNKKITKKFLFTKLNNYSFDLFNFITESSNIFTNEEKTILLQRNFYDVKRFLAADSVFLFLCSCSLRLAYRNLIENKILDSDISLDLYEDHSSISFGNSQLKVESHELNLLIQKRLTRLISSEILVLLKKNLEEKIEIQKIEGLQELQHIESELKEARKNQFDEYIHLLEKQKMEKDIYLSSLSLPPDYLINKLTVLINFLKKSHFKIETNPWYELMVASSHILSDVFKATVAEKIEKYNQKDITNTIITKIVIYLPKGLNRIYTFSDHLPLIVPPIDWNDDGTQGFESLSKYIHLGTSEIIYDPKTIRAINISQQKAFKINENYLNLLKEIDNAPMQDIKTLKLPFSPKVMIQRKKQELKILEEKLTLDKKKRFFINHLLDNEMLNASNAKVKLNLKAVWNEIFKIVGINSYESLKYGKYFEVLKEYQKMKVKKQIFNTQCCTGEIFKDFPLYFKSFTDYRGRMYPSSYLFSRTTGFYKYILSDFISEEVTVRGLIRMLESYYFNIPTKSLKFRSFIEKDPNLSRENVFNYFLENQLNDEEYNQNYLYLKLLGKEIQILPDNNYKTNFLIEIDQKSSASTFLAILLRNKQLATLSNLQGGDPKDINCYLQSKTREFILNHLKIKDPTDSKKKILLKNCPSLATDAERLISCFEKDRKLHKYGFMCYCYNQKARSRALQWSNKLAESFKLNNFENSLIWTFSSQYEKFLDFCFENFHNQIKAFDKIYDFFNHISEETRLRTIEGSVLIWIFYLLRTKTGSRFNPIRNRNENYKRTVPFTLNSSNKEITEIKMFLKNILKNFNSKDKTEQQKILKEKLQLEKKVNEIEKSRKELFIKKESAFKPGFIHSLDGAVIRMLIHKIYIKNNYIINHLHDSIQLHPNYVDSLYQEIYILYNEIIKIDVLKLFTEENKSQLNDKNIEKLNELINNFVELQEDIISNAVNINPENMYTPE